MSSCVIFPSSAGGSRDNHTNTLHDTRRNLRSKTRANSSTLKRSRSVIRVQSTRQLKRGQIPEAKIRLFCSPLTCTAASRADTASFRIEACSRSLRHSAGDLYRAQEYDGAQVRNLAGVGPHMRFPELNPAFSIRRRHLGSSEVGRLETS